MVPDGSAKGLFQRHARAEQQGFLTRQGCQLQADGKSFTGKAAGNHQGRQTEDVGQGDVGQKVPEGQFRLKMPRYTSPWAGAGSG